MFTDNYWSRIGVTDGISVMLSAIMLIYMQGFPQQQISRIKLYLAMRIFCCLSYLNGLHNLRYPEIKKNKLYVICKFQYLSV